MISDRPLSATEGVVNRPRHLHIPPILKKSGLGRPEIMLVDDEVALLELEKEFLEDFGYAVSAFSNPLVALDTFKNDPGRFHVLITDQRMPKMSGLQLCSAILAIDPTIPVILCTGARDEDTQRQANQLGIKLCLEKPFLPSEMKDKLQALVS